MDPQELTSSPPHQTPSFSDLPGPLGVYGSENWISSEIADDWTSLNDFYFCSPEPTGLQWSSHGTNEPQHPEAPKVDHTVLEASDDCTKSFSGPTGENDSTALFHPQPQNPVEHPQWLDGAFRPPVPCSHCRKHRLQCLIIRTTSANPNPVSSCSSCVALFRECSLAKGEKRLPSGFETFSPVLGHLHGLPEYIDTGVSIWYHNLPSRLS